MLLAVIAALFVLVPAAGAAADDTLTVTIGGGQGQVTEANTTPGDQLF